MIKFKKMSTFAKVASIGGVTAVVGVAFIPVINKFIDNPKSKVHVYEFNNRLFKTKDAAEDARRKFTAMSGLIQVMGSDKDTTPNVDYKPLMAEFVSFVSKLFVVKVFEMDGEASKTNHFKYDGMTDAEKQDILQKQIAGQIQYGDLKDVTSLVKYATAHKEGNNWMFTPTDELLLSILGDGSGQEYSLNELHYIDLTKKIDTLKAQYESFYSQRVTTKINGLSYSLVHGLVHHNDKELAMADHAKDITSNEGDGSGDEYTQDLVDKYVEWGKLKSAFELSKKNLDDFVSVKNITPAMKPILLKLIAQNAVEGWNNKERYSHDEITLRDLLAKATSLSNMIDSKVIPGNHQDTNTHIVEGWNWSPTGDETDTHYEDWQLKLAKDIQDRETLINLHINQAPDGALLGPNTAPTGDGSGTSYDQSVFDLKAKFDDLNAKVSLLTDQVNLAVTAKTKAAPVDGELSPTGIHIDPVGVGDGKDHSTTWSQYTEFKKLQAALASAQAAKAKLDQAIGNAMVDTDPNGVAGDEHEATLLAILDFDKAKEGWNWKQNFNQDQVDYAKAIALRDDLQKRIDDLLKDKTVVAAPEGATTTNLPAAGDQSGNTYTQDQINLRDWQKQLKQLGETISQTEHAGIESAPDGAQLNVDHPDQHSNLVGLGNGETYSAEFIKAAEDYRSYTSYIKSLQAELKVITDKYPTLHVSHGVSFDDIHKNQAVAGPNTGERFSDVEVKYSTDFDLLSSLQTTLADTTKAIGTFSIASDKATKLREDYAKGVTPILNENVKPFGDQSGDVFSPEDAKFRDALVALKTAFPKGNPWWTGTTGKGKESDEAYYNLYNDWKAAIAKGTELRNDKQVGDGTDHKFEDSKFNSYLAYFKDTIKTINDGGTKGKSMENDLDVILKYIKDHGTIFIKGSDTEISMKDDASKAIASDKDRGTGDMSGHTYLDMDDAFNAWRYAYHLHGGGLQKAYLTEQDKYQELKDKAADPTVIDGYNHDLNVYQDDLDTYNKEKQKLHDAVDPAEKARDAASREFDVHAALMKATYEKHDSPLYEYKNHKDRDDFFKMLAAIDLTTNKAGTLTQTQKDEIKELTGLDDKIDDAQSAVHSAQGKVNALEDGDKRKFYLRFTKLGDDLPILGKNYAGDGDKSGNTYTADQINGRDQLEALKVKLGKQHFSGSLDDEITRILKLVQNSQEGLNGSSAKGQVSKGDNSGTTWAQWEIDLYPEVSSIKEIRGRLNTIPFAPVGAHFGKNHEVTGDGTDKDYSSDDDKYFIDHYIKDYKAALKVLSDAKAAKKVLTDRKSALEKLNLNDNFDKDEKVWYVDDKGNAYKITAINGAKQWLDYKNKLVPYQTAKTDKAQEYKDAEKAVEDYIKNNKDDFDKWTTKIEDANTELDKLTPAKIEEQRQKMEAAKNNFDAKDSVIKAWWEDIKKTHNMYLDRASKDRNHPTEKLSDDYSTLVSDNVHQSGGLWHLDSILTNSKAHTDGQINKAASSKFTKEQFDARDALNRFAKLPTDNAGKVKVVGDMEVQARAMNTLFYMYREDVDGVYGKAWPKPHDYINPNGMRSATYDHIKETTRINFASNINDKMLEDFKKWLLSTFTDKTLQKNAPAKGDGTGIDYSKISGADKFFSYKGKAVETKTFDDKDFDLVQEALTVSIFRSSHKEMTAKSAVGKNFKATGDGSGLTYDSNDIAYYNAYKAQKEAQKKADDQQKIVDKDIKDAGETPKHTPAGYSEPKSATHKDPLGDGSDNDYTKEEIADVKLYFAKQTQIAEQQALLTKLEEDWKAGVLAKTYTRSWTEVTTISSVAKPGNNHDTLWTAAEIKYQGDNAKNKELEEKIHKLITAPASVVAAPDGAVFGLNNAKQGLGHGEKFTAEEIAKRDLLKDLNKQLDDAKAEIAAFVAKGTNAAPSKDTPVATDWHEVSTGDASDKFYSAKIFTDHYAQLGLTAAVKAAQAALDNFIKSIGQAGVDTIVNEVEVGGMVDGINTKEKYSTEEIALRDNKVSLGDANAKLKMLKSDSDYGIYVSLKPNSIPGKNEVLRGLGDGHDYTADEIKLRELSKMIKSEEALHGITSEADIVTYHDLFTDKDVVTTKTIRQYYNEIDLTKAITGDNHAAHGDETNAHYTTGDINTFNDIVALQTAIATNKAAIAALEAKGVTPAPANESEITVAEDPAFAGKHKSARGDASGNTYTQEYLDEAAEYDRLLKEFNIAELAFNDFVAQDPNLIKFFESKKAVDPLWDPIAGRNWTDEQFELKDLFDQREALGVGKTTVGSIKGSDSQFGVNNGHLGSGNSGKDPIVIYRGDDIEKGIQGSDQVRMGFVLKINGKVRDDSPVLDSLQAVAQYLQLHKDLASKGLIDKFAELQGISDTSDIYKISDEQVSKDRFNAMAENYEWGDK